MQHFWKVRSGDFAGYRRGDYLFNADGICVGYFHGTVTYSLKGDYIGEIYKDDWIGKRSHVTHSMGSPRAAHANLAVARYVDRVGLAVAGWEDPDF